MNLEYIKKENEKKLNSINIAPIREEIKNLTNITCKLAFSNSIDIKAKINKKEEDILRQIAMRLRPWRKGPFRLFNIFIDSEWKSYIKFNIIKKHIDVKDKVILDLGCNNGYYMFKLLEEKPKELIGFDPSALYKTQFDFINFFIKSNIRYEMLGIEHLELYARKFDLILCLGVLYHRKDILRSLELLRRSLKKDGELILDSFYISSKKDICLVPDTRYSKIKNVYFIPSISALKNLSKRAGFKYFEVLAKRKTSLREQRKTIWIEGESLEDFLDKDNKNKTIEGYEAPKRVYIKLKN